ncbi:cytochrome C oxidase subunit IV family protein [Ruegeria sp. Ofav3-42]|uniref:cytochrome C oxidase subunit IV family protein n=1 Tax=Ruegeria sp. Ofav3-42 TaxID=2917759 RepID=UPI001EF61F77|nr:cytochrome C oxidase subunit IV family protein [Ruegeria sp. Ofav3-42]MCG7520968.1 cytochrome C oxidase subunit IV family protein [Ruegeria sp. Ofav3-42]
MPTASPFPKYSNRRFPNALTSTWLSLLALSLATALLTLLSAPPELVGAGILILALIKARVILARYLDLAESPAWLCGFTMVLTGFSVVIFALYLI